MTGHFRKLMFKLLALGFPVWFPFIFCVLTTCLVLELVAFCLDYSSVLLRRLVSSLDSFEYVALGVFDYKFMAFLISLHVSRTGWIC